MEICHNIYLILRPQNAKAFVFDRRPPYLFHGRLDRRIHSYKQFIPVFTAHTLNFNPRDIKYKLS